MVEQIIKMPFRQGHMIERGGEGARSGEQAVALGHQYYEGVDVPQDYARAAFWYQQGAEKGHVLAQLILGFLYSTGRGVSQNYERACYWWAEAAKGGSISAAYNLGCIYALESGVLTNAAEAARWWQVAAEGGDLWSHYRLGEAYEHGLGVEQDYERAAWHYSIAAGREDILPSSELFFHSVGTSPEDLNKELEEGVGEGLTHENAHTGKSGRLARYRLARLYAYGLGVSRDLKTAYELSLPLAQEGDAASQVLVGRLYEIGLELVEREAPLPTDRQEGEEGLGWAAYWYHLAGIQGDEEGAYRLGLCYARRGQGCHPSRDLRFLGAVQETPQAVFQQIFEKREEDKRSSDLTEALVWFLKAGRAGHAVAQYNVGRAYAHGQGVAVDFSTAAKWYRCAAEGGLREAQYALGVLYYAGLGVPQDWTAAHRWFLEAAEQGDAASQNNLGIFYAHGFGVAQDEVRARYWLEKAAEGGYVDAVLALEEMAARKEKARLSSKTHPKKRSQRESSKQRKKKES